MRVAVGSRAYGLLAIGLPLLVYWRTMAPTVYGLDSAELTTGAFLLGIVHAPGSPLYLLVAHVFSWLPWGDVGYRVNLLSVCTAAGAVLLVYRLVARLTGDVWTAIGTSWMLAFSYYFWVSALAAELYAPQACVLAGLLWLGVSWRDTGRAWTLCAFALLYGLGLGVHLSLVMLTPGFLWLLWDRRRLAGNSRLIGAALLFGALGSAVYLYLPLRSWAGTTYNCPRDMGIDPGTLPGFLWVVSGRMFGDRLLAVPLVRLPIELEVYGYRLWSNFLGLGSLLGVVGLIRGFRRWPRLQGPLLLMFVVYLGFVLTYDVLDKETMLLPTYLIWALWIGVGAGGVAQYIGRRAHGRLRVSARALVLALAASALLWNYHDVDLSDDWSARDRGEAIFATLEPGALYLGAWMDVPILEYLKYVEGWRPDVDVVNLFFARDAWRDLLVEGALHSGRPVYSSVPRAFRDIGATFHYLGECKCYRGGIPPRGMRTQWENAHVPFRLDAR